MDASNLLKPALASGKLRCIGSSTYKEYRNYFEKDRALLRRFQKIDVYEPSIDDAIKILRGLKPYYEAHHKVRYTGEALKTAVELAARYINDRKLPDKAIDVIDEAGAAQMLLPRVEAQEDDRGEGRRGGGRQDRPDPAEKRLHRRQGGAAQPGARPEDHGIWPGKGDRGVDQRHQAGPRRAARAGEADRLLSVLRPDRGRQDRGGAPAGHHHGHRADALRHVRVHGAAQRQPADRRPARLCGLRPGRAVDRRRRPAPARRLVVGRDREGAPGPVQHPACRSWTTESSPTTTARRSISATLS